MFTITITLKIVSKNFRTSKKNSKKTYLLWLCRKMDAIKKKMQAMKLEKDNAMDRKVQPLVLE